ncbi:MAG TPA: sulfite exporter TauE/SafE family protein, partial [Caulobacteraceae bacterium]|nr:sulfite exporter TauE/SafE family protein [Caulobacteraceae bacterium]
TTGLAGRRLVSGAEGLSFRVLFAISVVGGVVGALLLLATPASFFARLLPWLVLAATAIFAWGSFLRRAPATPAPMRRGAAAVAQFLIAIYGGYFGGGIGFLMLAALTIAGLPVRAAGATKNALASVMNGAAVLIFAFSGDVHWLAAAILGVGAIAGGLAGAALLQRVNETGLRIGVVILGLALFAGLLWHGP